MAELARRLGVTVSSVSNLELNEMEGRSRIDTVDAALAALGLVRVQSFERTPDDHDLTTIVQDAERLVAAVAHTMALEGQRITEAQRRYLIERQIARKLVS